MEMIKTAVLLLAIQVITSHIVGTIIGKSVARIVWTLAAQFYLPFRY